MEWISFFGPRRPINGQKVYYFGPYIGVWQGRLVFMKYIQLNWLISILSW